jgi:hypothetical protein
MMHKSGAFSVDPRRHPCLAQILAGETSREEFYLGRKGAKLGYVGMAVHFRKVLSQDCSRRASNFAEKH